MAFSGDFFHHAFVVAAPISHVSARLRLPAKFFTWNTILLILDVHCHPALESELLSGMVLYDVPSTKPGDFSWRLMYSHSGLNREYPERVVRTSSQAAENACIKYAYWEAIIPCSEARRI